MTSSQSADKRQLALEAFRRDLPQQWLQRPGQWVAYDGAQPIGFAKRKHELYQLCFERGLKQDEFVIFCIEPEVTEMSLGPMVLDS